MKKHKRIWVVVVSCNNDDYTYEYFDKRVEAIKYLRTYDNHPIYEGQALEYRLVDDIEVKKGKKASQKANKAR